MHVCNEVSINVIGWFFVSGKIDLAKTRLTGIGYVAIERIVIG